MKAKIILKILFLILIGSDIVYTYIQNDNTMMLDGDLAGIVVPIESYKKVLTDPFGMSVVLHDEYYAATNRFFIHFFMHKYFTITPFLFQKFTDPIESLFISNILVRVLTQILLIYLISIIITGVRNIFSLEFLTVALIITPLFQMNGYNQTMGLSLNSVTYTFFYTLPAIFLLMYFYPFAEYFIHRKPIFKGCFKNQILLLLAFFIAFGGPLGPPIILILIPLILISAIIVSSSSSNKSGFIRKFGDGLKVIPRVVLYQFGFIYILSVYSLYVGTHNVENGWNSMYLLDRYELWLNGIKIIFTKKLGLPLLVFACILNIILLYRINLKGNKKEIRFMIVLLIFSVIYLLLLPFGGYREYRPYILRSDTFIPVTISLIIIYGFSFLRLLLLLKGRSMKLLMFYCATLGLIYTYADGYDKNVNKCQKDYLMTLQNSDQNIVELHGWCALLKWEKNTDPDQSKVSAEFIQMMNITEDKKLHWHPD